PSMSGWGVQHYTAGCHGTLGFYKTLLRVLNIAVQPRFVGCPNYLGQAVATHAQLFFPVIGAGLSHADDIYSRLFRDQPPHPGYSYPAPATAPGLVQNLLLTPAQFATYFTDDVPQSCTNVGVGVDLNLIIQDGWTRYILIPSAIVANYCE